jgi:hypothetical protein
MGRPITTVHYKNKRVPVSEYMESEQEALKDAVHLFQSDFGRLEVALANLLHAVLNAGSSRIPYAIYYSPNSFDARTEIVSNALTELASEMNVLQRLLKPQRWPFVEYRIGKIRNMRNSIAHGSAQVMVIGDKTYVRWIPPAHDAIRVGRLVTKGQVPGLQPHDIERSRRPFVALILVLETLNLFIREAHNDGFALRDKYRELEERLRAFRSLFPDAQKPPKQKRQPRPSSASRRKQATAKRAKP